MSIGPGTNAFKGFASLAAAPSCGGTWTTRPGNSSNPPGTLPPIMAVVVASNVTTNGSAISGNTVKIVIVQTNDGYGPSPGHAGTGKVVDVIDCQ
jgi:hypothetical protein